MQLLDEQNKRVEAAGRDERILSTSAAKRPPSHLAKLPPAMPLSETRRLTRAVEESTTCATARRLLLGTTALSSGMIANG